MVPIQYRPVGGAPRRFRTASSPPSARARCSQEIRYQRAALAGELAVAPGTVAAAYKLLRDRGVVEARGRNGTYVRPRPPLAARSGAAPLEPGVIDLASGQPIPACCRR